MKHMRLVMAVLLLAMMAVVPAAADAPAAPPAAADAPAAPPAAADAPAAPPAAN
mgnify:FL=1|jgi:hypothetical protein